MSKKSTTFFDMQFITSSISTMLVLLLLGMVVFFVMTASNVSVYVRENISLTVVVSDDVKESDILKLQKLINKEPFVKQSTYISKSQALKEQTEALGTDPSEFVGYNPFPALIEIKLKSDFVNPTNLQQIEKDLLKNKNIVEVSYPQELFESVNRNLGKVSIALLGLAGMLSLISFALINNTIRLAIYAKRFLIHTMKLVGASQSFIRRPFIIKNMWIGVFAALLANSVLMGMVYLLVDYEPDMVNIITPIIMLTVIGVVFLFGIFITSICSLISINKYLRMRVGDLYSY